MIKTITAPKLSEIIPESIKGDKKIFAAAVALDTEIEKISALANLTLHLPRLDELPSNVLDHLAYQFHCDFYRTDMTDEQKRKQIRESIFWHRIKGTPAGVEKGMSTFVDKPRVVENWEYGGEPYFFKIVCGGLKSISDDVEFLRLLYAVKNTRSWLEDFMFDLTLEEPQKLVTAIAELDDGGETTEIQLDGLRETQKIACGFGELESGVEVTEFETYAFDEEKYFYATAELESGVEYLNLETEPVKNELWLIWYLRETYKKWKLNPVLEPYAHTDEGEDFPPFDPDVFPADADFLRLYFGFPDHRYRYITLHHPREDLTAKDIKKVGALSVNLLKSTAGLDSHGLVRAFYLKRKIYKVF